uniref:DNA-directed RNA polymerase III subunit n=1 Tax=Panagrolaimus sp. JU765 TaxID=591449 RepID=A0AC34Q141_9BILA
MNRRKTEAKNGVRAIASAMGIQRHEMGAFTKMKSEPPPLFPPIHKPLLPSVNASVQCLEIRCNLENEFVHHFNSLETNTQTKKTDPVLHRYSDDFIYSEKRSFVPNICDLPKGLYPLALKRKLAKEDEIAAKKQKKMEEKWSKLENKEKTIREDDVEEEEGRKNEEDEEEEELAGSDEEIFEEDNDYIHAYFDNGEGYNENPSDDNLEDGDVY